jgi:hypothetical protein
MNKQEPKSKKHFQEYDFMKDFIDFKKHVI